MKTKNIQPNIESFPISSNLFPCIFVGMYDTLLSPVSYQEDMCEYCRDTEHPFSYFTVDSDKWEQEILDCSADFVCDEVVPIMRKYGVQDITVESIYSPKYYNFETDCLYFTVHMVEGWREKMHKFLADFRKDSSTKFTDYIHEHWHSCDGFMSFMPQDIDEVEAFEDKNRCLGAYLTLCLLNEDAIGLAEQFYEDTAEWLYFNSTAGKTHNVLDDYLDDEQEADNYVELYNNDFRIDNLCHSLYEHQGHLWRGCNDIEAKYDSCITFHAENEAQRMIFWAVKKGLTVADLYHIAA